MAKQLSKPNVIEADSEESKNPLSKQLDLQNAVSPMSQTLTEEDVNPSLGKSKPTPESIFQGSGTLPELDPDISAIVGFSPAPKAQGKESTGYASQRDGGFVAEFEGEYIAHSQATRAKVVRKFGRMKAIVLNKRLALKELKRMILPTLLKNHPEYGKDFIRVRLINIISIEPIPGTPDVELGRKMSDIPLMSFDQLCKLIEDYEMDIDPSIYEDDLLALRASILDTLNSNPRMNARKSVREENMLYQRKLREAQKTHAHLLK